MWWRRIGNLPVHLLSEIRPPGPEKDDQAAAVNDV
jgi:hypothetical protein